MFWVEASTFTWQDAFIYMVMTDRFKDGDPSNNPAPITSDGSGSAITVDPREDYHGGDIAGVTAEINAGTFDQLGVSVMLMSPFNTNPSDAWIASDNYNYVSGFHGYWPTKARQVDPRFGTEADLHAMVTAAHAHGIRVIQDLVVQHVHQEHEYLATHPEWFNTTGCICGTDNCDWTVHRLDCRFTDYLPNIDWTNADGAAQWVADAIWWLDTFDLDGFRMDAVKQVPDLAVINLVTGVRGEFEATGNKVFMTGETAMGWNSDNILADSLSQYQLVSQYINPDGLDGQFDFTLYYADPLNVFANQSYGMDHADYWVQASGWEYPHDALMSPYIGSQDAARFISDRELSRPDGGARSGHSVQPVGQHRGPPPDSGDPERSPSQRADVADDAAGRADGLLRRRVRRVRRRRSEQPRQLARRRLELARRRRASDAGVDARGRHGAARSGRDAARRVRAGLQHRRQRAGVRAARRGRRRRAGR